MAKKKSKKAKKLKKVLGVEGFRNEWEQLQLNLLFTNNWINQNLRNIYAYYYSIFSILVECNDEGKFIFTFNLNPVL